MLLRAPLTSHLSDGDNVTTRLYLMGDGIPYTSTQIVELNFGFVKCQY